MLQDTSFVSCQDIPIALDKDKASLAADWLTAVLKPVVDCVCYLITERSLLA